MSIADKFFKAEDDILCLHVCFTIVLTTSFKPKLNTKTTILKLSTSGFRLID